MTTNDLTQEQMGRIVILCQRCKDQPDNTDPFSHMLREYFTVRGKEQACQDIADGLGFLPQDIGRWSQFHPSSAVQQRATTWLMHIVKAGTTTPVLSAWDRLLLGEDDAPPVKKEIPDPTPGPRSLRVRDYVKTWDDYSGRVDRIHHHPGFLEVDVFVMAEGQYSIPVSDRSIVLLKEGRHIVNVLFHLDGSPIDVGATVHEVQTIVTEIPERSGSQWDGDWFVPTRS